MAGLRSRLRPGTAAGALALAVPIAVAAVVTHRATGRYWGDLAAYRAGARAATAGDGNLYDLVLRGVVPGVDLAFVYPPFPALLLRPLAAVSFDAGIALWTLLSVLALAAVVARALRLLAPGTPERRHALLTLGGTVAALPTFPVSGHLQAGQVGLFLMLVVLLDLTGDPDRWWRGLGVGLAAGVKLTPLIFVAYLLVTRRFRAALAAAGTFLATIAVGYAWHPADSTRFWSGAAVETGRINADPRWVFNQSLHGALARIGDTATPPRVLWLLLAAFVGVAGLALAARAARAGDELLGVLTCALTGVLVSPISWHHHWVWFVPALLLLAVRSWPARRRAGLVTAGGVWLGLVASTGWVVLLLRGDDLHFHGAGLLIANGYVLVGLLALAAVAYHLHRPHRPPAPTGGRADRTATPAPLRTGGAR
ncbi:glycosyltransferase 87 family protein [Micromonospora sp. B11E3]|uniref:glycosyltransferase 87 family protein n=1 Tax=Micromonospora sp. B11E3 TaxID=3153562 RepID=UPI00325E896B